MADDDRAEIIRKLLLDKASELFFSYGYSNTTTEQIAGELQISKKTLYKNYPRKEDLLFAVIERAQNEISKTIRAIVENPDMSFIEKARALGQYYGSHIAKIPVHFYRDMEKLKPGWKQEVEVLPSMETFFNEGIAQGYIRKDINVHMIMVFMRVSMEGMIQYASNSRDDFSVQDVLNAVPCLFAEGFLTEKGRLQVQTSR